MQEKSRWYSCARDAARRGGVDSPQIIIEWAFGELYKFDSSSVDRTWKLITKIVKNRVKPFVQSWLTSFLVTWNFFLARFGNAMSVGKFGWYSPPPANPEAFATALSGAAMCIDSFDVLFTAVWVKFCWRFHPLPNVKPRAFLGIEHYLCATYLW